MLREPLPPWAAGLAMTARRLACVASMLCGCSLQPRVVQTAFEPVVLDAGVDAGQRPPPPRAGSGGSARGGAGAGGAGGSAANSCAVSLASRLSITTLNLQNDVVYKREGIQNFPLDERVAFTPAPDGSAYVAWNDDDNPDTLHVTPLTAALIRGGDDVVISGRDVGGIAAREDGFALLTVRPDPGQRLAFTSGSRDSGLAVVLLRYRGAREVFAVPLTGTASVTAKNDPSARDCSPGYLYGRLAWNGAKYGAYFMTHACEGDPHVLPANDPRAMWSNGDKLVYVDDTGAGLRGGRNWNCSLNQGLRLWPGPDVFTPVCLADLTPAMGLNVVMEDQPPMLLSAEAAGPNWCSAQLGSVIGFPDGTFAVGFLSSDVGATPDVPARPTPDIAMLRLDTDRAPIAPKRWLLETPAIAETNVHFAPYGAARILMIWDSIESPTCNGQACFGSYGGTYVRVIDRDGTALTGDERISAVPNTGDDLSVLPNGDVAWAYVADSARDYQPLQLPRPSKSRISIARLRYCE
jgi:hypothetical protein